MIPKSVLPNPFHVCVQFFTFSDKNSIVETVGNDWNMTTIYSLECLINHYVTNYNYTNKTLVGS